jgi:hypothetical protein
MTAAIYRRRDVVPAGPTPYRSIEHNYSILPPGPPWRQDIDLARQLAGVLAFHRDDPDAQVVLAVRQYPTYVPTAAELTNEAVARLRKCAFKNLQYEAKSDGAMFAGKPAGRLVFQGTVDDEIMSGDVQFLTHQGAAYWLYRWCPAAAVDTAATDLADFAERFALLNLRPDWQLPRQMFASVKFAYALTAEGNRWEKSPSPPTDYDPAADMALLGQPQDGSAEAVRKAQLLVLILAAADGDPVARARAHVLARQKVVYEGTTIAEIPPTVKLWPTDRVGAEVGRLLTVRVTNTKARERFGVLGVVPRATGPLVIWAECDFSRRAEWEAEFHKLIGSLQTAK